MLHELMGETTGLEEVDLTQDAIEFSDELAVRSAMIRLQQLRADAEKVKHTRDVVKDAYDSQLASIEDSASFIERSLQEYVERNGNVKLPDVGTAYLAKQGPRIKVVDRDAFRAATGEVFVKEQWDETWAKQYALDLAVNDGELMPGCVLEPGGPALRIRGR